MQGNVSASWHRGPKLVPLSDRFSTKVDRDGPIPERYPEFGNCHDWTAAIHPKTGYGQIGRGGAGSGAFGAHTAAWELASGSPVPEGKMVGHTCDRKMCVRNDEPGVYWIVDHLVPRFGHLWLGTLEENNADMRAKGRSSWQSNPQQASEAMRKPRRHEYNQGEGNAHAKLNDVLVLEIRRRFAAGETNKAALAREYGVTDALIGFIIRRKAWAHVSQV